jgi:hypothetical protein
MALSERGPIEQVWQRLLAGELSDAGALQLVTAPEVTAKLDPASIAELCDATESLSITHARDATRLHRLTLAAVEAAPGAEAEAMRRDAGMAWLEVAARALSDVPDGRVLRQAVAVGERLAHQALERGDREEAGVAFHRLGVLHLDPYTAGRTSTNHELQMRQWQNRTVEVLGAELAGVPPAEWQVPPAREALRTAEQYLRRAAELRQGRGRALTLKALVQALEWRTVLGEKVPAREIAALCHDALAIFDPVRDVRERAAVVAALDRQAGPVPDALIDPLLATPLVDWAERLGPLPAVDLAMQLLALVRSRDPRRTLALVRQAQPLAERAGATDFREQLWRTELEAMVAVRLPGTALDPPDAPLATVADRIRKRARREGWSNETLGAALIWLARWAPHLDEEATALELVQDALARAPGLATEHGEAVVSLQAALYLGLAVNAVNAGQSAEAVRIYSSALDRYLRLRLERNALDCVGRMEDLLGRGDDDTVIRVMAALAQHGTTLEERVGEPATRRIQEMCRTALARLAGSGGAVKAELLGLILNVAKGLRFAAALLRPRPYDWRDDERAVTMLERVREAEAALPPAPPAEQPGAVLEGVSLLAAYLQPGERLPGHDAREVVENLQQAYDEYLGRRLLADVEDSAALFPTIDQVREAIDDRTVVLTYLLAPAPAGESGVLVLAFTRDDVTGAMGRAELPSGVVQMSAGGRKIVVPLLGVTMETLYESIEAEPESGPVSGEAGQLLASEHDSYIERAVGRFLAEQRARGRDHLCVVPHGPLHFLPFHLLGAPGHPLADDWIVTYLPNLRLLTRHATVATRRPADVAAIGIGFAGTHPPGLPPIPEAVEEARAIAALFGHAAIVDDAATPAAVTGALEDARWVHLATHGAHHFSAPAFQRLYLAPDDRGDGVLHAYEVLALDLRGLELLTLGACETALGRFDQGDNLRGLPASFFLAGVHALVGTLWPAETRAAHAFFTRLYECLRAGASRLDAFGDAQRTTRAAFPDYRDWGPFYLMGQWS